MAFTFTPQQLKGLEIANTRLNQGTPSPEDIKNLNYAKQKGWSPQAPRQLSVNTIQPQAQINSMTMNNTANPFLPSATATPPITPQTQNPSDNFNMLLIDLLKKAKGVNTNELLKRQRALQRTALGEQEQITPEELRTFSPAQQSAMRAGNISALRPEFDENAFQMKQAETAIANFEDVYAKATSFNKEFAEKMVAPQSVIENYAKAIEADPEKLATYLTGLNDKTRQAVISALDYTKMKKKQAPIEVSPGASIYDPVTGEAVYTAPSTPSKTTGGIITGTKTPNVTPTEKRKIDGWGISDIPETYQRSVLGSGIAQATISRAMVSFNKDRRALPGPVKLEDAFFYLQEFNKAEENLNNPLSIEERQAGAVQEDSQNVRVEKVVEYRKTQEEAKKFITREFLKENGLKISEKELNKLIIKVEQLRKQQYSDKEIMKELFEQ